MMIIFLTLLFSSSAFDTVGWFIENSGCGTQMTPDTFPFEYYTHVLVGHVNVSANGTATCDSVDPTLKRFVELSKSHDIKIMVREGIPATIMYNLTTGDSMANYRTNYLASIKNALNQCGVNGGIEFDYEFDTTLIGITGYVSEYESMKYTQFLSDIKVALGPDKQVGCNIGIWGFGRSSFPLMLKPWVNVSMVNDGAIDYVNIMSYHGNDNTLPWIHNDQSILPWEIDAQIVTNIWGFKANKINIGVPNYYFNKSFNEPLWCNLSEKCQNIDPSSTICQEIHIVSKMQNYNIGKYIKEKGFRGALPWAANYDSLTHNNTMVKWINLGFNNKSSLVYL